MLAAIAVIGLVAAQASTTSPAAGQQAEPLEPAALSGTIDPAAIVDVESFSARAVAWAEARADHQDAALSRAVALAAETKAAEDAEQAEQARLEAEEQARLEAEEAHRRAHEEEARRAAEAAAAATTTTTAGTAPPSDTVTDEPEPEEPVGEPSTGGPTPEQWHALRECESGNNYTAVSPSGRYRGAYQFSVSTWDWLAGSRYPELVGVDPIQASPADQDQMAYALYDLYGKSPWPVCGQHLP